MVVSHPDIAYIFKCSIEMLYTNSPFFIGGYMETKLQQGLKCRSYSSLPGSTQNNVKIKLCVAPITSL